MKQQYGLVRRPWGASSIDDKHAAQRILNARNESEAQLAMNLSLARVYLNGAEPKLSTRTWQEVMESIVLQRTDETRRRWEVAIKDRQILCKGQPRPATNRWNSEIWVKI